MSDDNKVPGILGELPISRALYLETLPEKFQKELDLLTIIFEQLVHANEKANIQIKNKLAETPVVSVDKEFGAESLNKEEDDDPYKYFSPYLSPIFNLQSIVENLSASIRRLRDLDGFLSHMGITITELIEIDRETLLQKIKEYQSNNKDIL